MYPTHKINNTFVISTGSLPIFMTLKRIFERQNNIASAFNLVINIRRFKTYQNLENFSKYAFLL